MQFSKLVSADFDILQFQYDPYRREEFALFHRFTANQSLVQSAFVTDQ